MTGLSQDMRDGAGDLLAEWVSQPPRAAHFIVTIYGDVVEPRGGILWMGTLIEICEAVGLSESLVRTAVSRLVSGGQLTGERAGRRSFYRLTDKAQVDFAAAARVLFSKPETPETLVFLIPNDSNARLPVGFVPVGPDLLAGPGGPGVPLPDGLALRAEVIQGAAALPSFAARHWDLERHAAAYRHVLTRFASLEARLDGGALLSPEDSLVARLLLVDDFREAIFQDPGLPSAALPPDWPGQAARALFARLYRSLSVSADSHVSSHFRNAAGLLPAVTEQVRARMARLTSLSQTTRDAKNTKIS